MLQNKQEHQHITESLPLAEQAASIPSFSYKLNNYNTLEKMYKIAQYERQSEDMANESLTHNEKEQYKKEYRSSNEIDGQFDEVVYPQESNEYVRPKKKNQNASPFTPDQQNFYQQYKQTIMKHYQLDESKSSVSNSQTCKRQKNHTKRRQQISCRFSVNEQEEQNRRNTEKIYRQLSYIQFSLLEQSQNYQEYRKYISHTKRIEKSSQSKKTNKRKTQIHSNKIKNKQAKKQHATFLIESKAHQSEFQPIQFEFSSASLDENSLRYDRNLDKQYISHMDDLIL